MSDRLLSEKEILDELNSIKEFNDYAILHHNLRDFVKQQYTAEINLINYLIDIIKQMPSRKSSIDWIFVEEGLLPPEGEKVFVLIDGVYPFTYTNIGWRVGPHWICDNREVLRVKAWAPTDDSSKEEEDNG